MEENQRWNFENINVRIILIFQEISVLMNLLKYFKKPLHDC